MEIVLLMCRKKLLNPAKDPLLSSFPSKVIDLLVTSAAKKVGPKGRRAAEGVGILRGQAAPAASGFRSAGIWRIRTAEPCSRITERAMA